MAKKLFSNTLMVSFAKKEWNSGFVSYNVLDEMAEIIIWTSAIYKDDSQLMEYPRPNTWELTEVIKYKSLGKDDLQLEE